MKPEMIESVLQSLAGSGPLAAVLFYLLREERKRTHEMLDEILYLAKQARETTPEKKANDSSPE